MYLFSRKAQSMAHFESPEKMQVTKLDFVWCALVFTVLELGFLVLATHCLSEPIPLLPSLVSSLTLVEAKAVTTAIAVSWHAVALFPIKDIISTIFSAECIAQYRRTGRLQPNITDCVSCITSGLLAQVSHFLTLRPTMEYRLAFLLVLSTMALIPLGPSVVDLNPSWITHHEDLQIANLTMSKGFMSIPQRQCFSKADEIVNMELVEGGTYGYETQTKNMLIPWPKPGLETSQNIIKYESDVAVYNYTCRWPGFTFKESNVVITEEANISWTPWNGAPSRTFFGIDVTLPLSNSQDNPPPSSAFIFVNEPQLTQFSNLSTSIRITKKDMAGANDTIKFQPGFMAAILLCDPQYTIQTAEVTLQDGQLNASLVGLPLLGNLPESAANALFSQAFLNSFAPRDTMSRPATSAFIPGHGDHQALLPLPEINQNMNEVIQSAAKAYISGYTGFNGMQLFPDYTSFNQTVTVQHQQISLATSRPFLVVLWVLDVVIVLILIFLLCTANVEEMQPFDLQTMQIIYRDLPVGDDVLLSSQHHHTNLRASKLVFACRMIAFVILEFGFLVFAKYCLTKPIPVHLPPVISASQARSVVTAVAVVWRTLAVLPVKDIVCSVFSTECVAQYRRTGQLEPKSTDRVSRITSGLMEQVPHFSAGRPTLEYRLAFLLVLLVMVLGPLGPGVVTLTDSVTTRPQGLRMANMSMNQGFASFLQRQISQRAKIFVELELLEGRVYGYDTDMEGVLIPWPESGLERSQNVHIYESDVVVYNYSCHWPTSFSTIMPVKSNHPDLAVIIAGVQPNGTVTTLLPK